MIPRFGRTLPFIISVLGIIDVKYAWSINKDLSIIAGIATILLIYFMFKRHASVPPSRGLHHIVTPFLLMLVILITSWFIYF